MPLPMRKSYFLIFDLHIRISLRHFYLQYYIYILNILFDLKASFTCKSESFLLIVGTILSVLLRPCKDFNVRLNCNMMFCP
jgi:hypothetical protein